MGGVRRVRATEDECGSLCELGCGRVHVGCMHCTGVRQWADREELVRVRCGSRMSSCNLQGLPLSPQNILELGFRRGPPRQRAVVENQALAKKGVCNPR